MSKCQNVLYISSEVKETSVKFVHVSTAEFVHFAYKKVEIWRPNFVDDGCKSAGA